MYLWLAEERGWRVTHVLDTHGHADHLSRSRRLSELVEATLHMPEGASVTYSFSGLGDGDALEVGSATLEAVRTPGHTPESTSYLLEGRALFTGDTLFLLAVGRPQPGGDAGGGKGEGARPLRFRAFATHIDDLSVSDPCVARTHERAGALRRGADLRTGLRGAKQGRGLLEDEDRFLQKVVGGLSPTPENYERIVELNRSGGAARGRPNGTRGRRQPLRRWLAGGWRPFRGIGEPFR